MKKILLFSIFLWLFMLSIAYAATSPTVATVRVSKAYMSANGDCSSPVTLFDVTSDPTAFPNGYAEVDMVQGPTIGQGVLPDGTYQCVIFKMSDQISFTPAATEGAACIAGQSYTIDICSSHDGGVTAPSTKNPETGATVSCTIADGTNDTVWIYISTYSTATTGSAQGSPFTPPTQSGDAINGFSLASGAITISSNVIGTFVFGVNNIIATLPYGPNGSDVCNMGPPSFGFTTVVQ